MMMRPIRIASLSLLFGLFALAACNANGTSTLREPDDYQGCATDENWRTFDDYELTGQVTLDDAQAPAFTNLSDGMTLAANTELAWNLSSTMPGKPTGDAVCTQCPNCGPLTIQHQPPVSGDVYDLQFSTGGVLAWRALTTLQTYRLPDTEWAQLRGKPVSLRMTRLLVKLNDVESGPFQPTKPITFTVAN
jgi:hypothetical protein